MSIAKVEPLTTARALRGPFDYRLPAAMEGLEVGSVVRVPFGRQRLLGVVVELAERSELPPERLAEPIEALEAGTPAELVRLGLWIAREYCSTPSRGLQLVLPPGTGAGGQRVRSRLELRAEIAAAGEAALSGGERLGVKQRAVLEALRAGEMSAPELAAAVGSDRAVLRRLEERGLIATRSSRVRRRSSHPEVGARGGSPELLPEQAAAVRSIVAALDGEAGARASSSCTASPARARPRSTSPRSRRRWRGARGRSSSSPRSAWRRRRWRASGPGSATASPSCTRPCPTASATTNGAGCAAARRASASVPAPPSSRRCATSA